MLNGIINSRMFIGTAIRYIIRLRNKQQTVIVRVQNTHDHENQHYAHGEQVKIWFYMEDARLLLR